MTTRDGSAAGPTAVGTLLDALDTGSPVATRRVQCRAVGANRISKVCTWCGHRQTLDLLDVAGLPMTEADAAALAARLDGAPHVCSRCSIEETV